MKNKWFLPLSIGLVIGGSLGAWGMYLYWDNAMLKAGANEVRQRGFEFVSPLISCEIYPKSLGNRARAIEYEVQNVVDQALGEKRAAKVSVYFRDLNNGPWFGINEKEAYNPSSLMKIPVALASLKLMEKDPSLLQKTFLYDSILGQQVDQFYGPKELLRLQQSYTLENLLFRTLAWSDNQANNLIIRDLVTNSLPDAFNQIGLPFDQILREFSQKEDYIRLTDYAGFFRALYNASYLSPEYSEIALQMMSQSQFTEGIRAGLPEGTKVANKFGVFLSTKRTTNRKQLHDCGIVYLGNRPYLLCVMTQGEDYAQLATVIADISRTVATEIAKI